MRKTKKLIKMLVAILAVNMLIPVIGMNIAHSADNKFTFKMGNWAPRGIVYEKVLYNPFCKMVNKMSNGRLNIVEVYDGEGVAAKEVFSAVGMGLIEMGAPFQGYYAGELPAGLVELGLPGTPGHLGWQILLQYKSKFKDAVEAAYNAHNIHVLGEWFWTPTYLITKEPIKSIGDLRNIKVRATGALSHMLRSLGASPVMTTFGEMYTAAATGVINATAGAPLSDYRDIKMHEVLKYIYPSPISTAWVTPIIINKNKWEELPTDLQEILTVATKWMGAEAYAVCLKIEKEALEEMKKSGMDWGPKPSSEDEKAWKKAGLDTWPLYKEKDKDAAKLINLLEQFMKENDL